MSVAGAVRAGGAFVEIFAQDGRFQQGMARVRATLRATAAMMRRTGTEMVLGTTAVGMPMILAIRQAARYQDAILGMRAAAGLTAEEVARLEGEVMRLSSAMGVDPANIADAFLELAKAGMGVEEIIDGAGRSAVEFARVSGVEMADAAVFMKVAMNTFGVSASEAVDTLSAAADASETSISELVQAFALVGSAGVSFDQTLFDLSLGLAALARFGIRSEEAGTGIKTMLMRLVSPADTAQEAMARVGLTIESFRDDAGELLPLVQIVDVLARALAGVDKVTRDQVIGDIFGDRAIRIVGAFLELGVDGFGELAKQMQGNLPVAQKFAILMSGITGTIQRLYAAVQRLAIVFADAVAPAMAEITAGMLFVIESASELVRTFPRAAQALLVFLSATFSIGVASIAAGMALFVVERGLGVVTRAFIIAVSPVVMLGRAFTATALLMIQHSGVVVNAMGQLTVAVARLAAGMIATAAYAVPVMVAGLQAMAVAVAGGVLAMTRAATAQMAIFAAAAATRFATVAAVATQMGRELAAVAMQMVFSLNRATFGFVRFAEAVARVVVAEVIAAMPAVASFALLMAQVALVVGGAVAIATVATAGISALAGGLVALATGAYNAVTGLVGAIRNSATAAIDATRQMAAAWGQQLSWMHAQLKAQNYAAIWQAMSLDFQIAMLQLAKAADAGIRYVQGAFVAAFDFITDSIYGAFDRMTARIEQWFAWFQLRAMEFVGTIRGLLMMAQGYSYDEARAVAMDTISGSTRAVDRAAGERARAERDGMDRRGARTEEARRRQEEMDASAADFDAGIEALRSQLNELMARPAPEEEAPAGPLEINPAEFRDPMAGIGAAADGGSGIGQTQGGFGADGSGLGVGPELNVVAMNTGRGADAAEAARDELAAIRAGMGDGVGRPDPAGIAGNPAIPALAQQARDGMRRSSELVQLRETSQRGFDAVVQAIREHIQVTAGQSQQLAGIASSITQLRGALV